MTRRKRYNRASDVNWQINQLRHGQPVPAWVCREWLSLDAKPSVHEIAVALHNELHAAQRMNADEQRKHRVASIVAAGVVMAEFLNGE